MKSLIAILFVALLGIFSCEPVEQEQTEIWWINSAKVECVGVGPMQCLQIQKNQDIDPTKWQMFYDKIEGFDYQPGNIYQIEVKVGDKEEPIPADASSKTYKLLKVMSEEPDPKLRLTNIWNLIKVGEFNNPTLPNSEEPLTFEFNASEMSYLGNTGCNSVRGKIEENDGSKLRLGPGAMTKKACMDMTVENAVTTALNQVSSYSVADRTLILFDSSGSILMEFQAAD
ncbi:DUF4377 domain-containing protein [Algoriphagus sp. PAP.12]|uniref:DUF4377 domain-containing protein n=1 Tax=Algoriphagus sp. PAP.12 TaxID=2996678 RepID=UPI00227B28E2|nr:DUF4377 domain-containing protein [Algoriphagus sp. PAP.12]